MHADSTSRSTPRLHGDPRVASRMRWWVLGGAALVIIAAILNVWLDFRRDTLPEEVAGVARFEGLEDRVVEGPVAYPQRPPAGGPHAALPQLCGVYRVPVQDEHVVAALATGAVWLTYRPDLPASEVELLDGLALGEYDVILSPYPGQQAPVVATAWGRQLSVEDAADERLALFLAVYKNGDNAPRPDDTCSAGVGLPAP